MRETDLVGMLAVEMTLLTSTLKLPLWCQRGTSALVRAGRATRRAKGEKRILNIVVESESCYETIVTR